MNSAERTIELLTQLKNSKKNLADTLVSKGEVANVKEPFDDLVQKAADYIPKSYIFVDEEGNEVAGTLVEEKTVFDATENDVREGKVFATELGVKTGTKVIPIYFAHQGSKIVTAGKAFTINGNNYDYTKLQAMICLYNSNSANSVATEKVVINDNVYMVQSVDSIAVVTKDDTTKNIVLNITNDTNKPQILRYFYFREVE